MVQVVTYCRVSSEEQAQKDISIPAQRKALKAWIGQQGGMALAGEFSDQGISAYAPADKRPGFCEMVSFCRKHKVAFILVHKLDRFSRNREESILFKSLLRKHGVQVKSISENFDADTPQGFLYEGMIEVINQFYSMNLATETLKGMRENAERGAWNGGRVPYGYKLESFQDGERKRSRLVPGDPEHVATVRLMFDWSVNQNMGVKAIANRLNLMEVPGPRGPRWSAASINFMLKNPVYVGDKIWGKTKKKGRNGREKASDDERIVARNVHPPLVERALWEKRQELSAKRAFDATPNPRHHTKYLLSRMIRCEHCGNNFVGRRNTHKDRHGKEVTHRRYYCSGYLYKGKDICPSLPIDQKWVEDKVVGLIRERLSKEGSWDELERKVRERIEARKALYGGDQKAVQRRLEELKQRLDNWYRAIGDGVDLEICKQHIAETKAKIEVIEREAEVLAQEDYYTQALERNLKGLEELAEAFQKDFDSLPFGTRRNVITRFVEDIAVVDREALRVRFQVPFDNGQIQTLTDEMEQVRRDITGGAGPQSQTSPPVGVGLLSASLGNVPPGSKWLPLLDSNQ